MRRQLAARGTVWERFRTFFLALVAAICCAAGLSTARAAITTTGNVEPADPSSWQGGTTDVYIGKTANGGLTIDSGSSAGLRNAYLGYNSGTTGDVTVDGPGSWWWSNSRVYVGYSGTGILKISNGGAVQTIYTAVASGDGSTSAVTVEGAGSSWTNYGNLDVGYHGNGRLNVTHGGTVHTGMNATSPHGFTAIGRAAGSTGALTVDGVGSTWVTDGELNVGLSGGVGTLNITGGGAVTAGYGTYIGRNGGSTGTVNFGPDGGTLTTGVLCASPAQLTGVGTINARTLVSDLDLVFDSAHGLKQTIVLNGAPGQTITVNLEVATGPGAKSELGAGWNGAGFLTIRDGTIVPSGGGVLGYQSGSTGTARVDGPGSTWASQGSIFVGSEGSGTLKITNGGLVSIAGSYGIGSIGDLAGSKGFVTVDGAGSTWTSGDLHVGNYGNGTLNISGGGAVSTQRASINGSSVLSIDVGYGSSFTVGGTITNTGTVRIVSGTRPAAGAIFTPITAGTWTGSGTYQAIGGTWDAGSHALTVSDVVPGTAGTPVSIDLAAKQRVLLSDSRTGWSLGTSFSANTNSSVVNVTASPIGGSSETMLESLLRPSESILSGWTISATGGYAAGDPAYLSFALGGGYSRNALDVWHYDGTHWSAFDAGDLTYDGNYASFTVTGFSAYAITGLPIVPGDANSDGRVDVADLNKVLTNYSQSGMTWTQGDFDGNGTVDINDLNKVLANYNKSVAAGAGIRAVPEPSALVLLPLGGVGLLGWGRRRRVRSWGLGLEDVIYAFRPAGRVNPGAVGTGDCEERPGRA